MKDNRRIQDKWIKEPKEEKKVKVRNKAKERRNLRVVRMVGPNQERCKKQDGSKKTEIKESN